MDTKQSVEMTHPLGELVPVPSADAISSVLADTFAGRIHIQWDSEAAVTPLGQLAFFVDFLKTAELFDPWVEGCPLKYASNNGPKPRDVLGTLFLSVLSGHWRYAHIDTIRFDTVNPGLLGMEKVVSSTSARRAFLHADAEDCACWLHTHMHRSYAMLLWEPWILDVDTTVKLLYGHQEGAVLGYNPSKPGRPSHVLHTYFMANTRLVLDVETRPGNETAAKYTMPGLWAFLDSLPRGAWPRFIRGDCNFGCENSMREAEERGIPYLFKLRQTSKVKTLIRQAFDRRDWVPAGQGFEGVEDELMLSGWTRKRRVIVLRRKVKAAALSVPEPPLLPSQQLQFIELTEGATLYEYMVLVTSLADEIVSVAQLYRDRGDAENIYDEQKNQWGWGGYTTHDLKRCQIMARIIALVYNWWTLFVRLAIPDRHAEAITSRPLLLSGVGHQTRHGGQTSLTITPIHAQNQVMQKALGAASAFLHEVRATARQLDWSGRWHMILSRIFSHMLGGRPLAHPNMLPVPT